LDLSQLDSTPASSSAVLLISRLIPFTYSSPKNKLDYRLSTILSTLIKKEGSKSSPGGEDKDHIIEHVSAKLPVLPSAVTSRAGTSTRI
jgi:hypothetical protein